MTQGARTSETARKRAAVEMIASYEAALRRTARRYSFDDEDAEDAYQRALEIALTKAPTTDLRELIRWTQTVVKHEALAVRQSRKKLLGYQPRHDREAEDPVALLPARGDGPEEQVERREDVARSREALQALKPAELQALSLLAEGFSYAEIGARTGFSQTKINRLLAEGRARFRSLIARSEDGSRCQELQPLLSSFCDGEASLREAALVREHLRACASCRATMRAYREAPRIVAALLPLLPPSRSLLSRAHELASHLVARLPGFGGRETAIAQVAAAGGTRGAGFAGLAKLLTLCAGAAGGAAACMATGVLPAPAVAPTHGAPSAIERPAASVLEEVRTETANYEPAAPQPVVPVKPEHEKAPVQEVPDEPAEPSGSTASAVEYEAPPPEPAPAPPVTESAAEPSSTGSAAGEFGP